MSRNEIPVSHIQPGERFVYRSSLYIRATEDEAYRHPARELQVRHSMPLVYAYMLRRERRTPVSFVPVNDEGPVMVMRA